MNLCTATKYNTHTSCDVFHPTGCGPQRAFLKELSFKACCCRCCCCCVNPAALTAFFIDGQQAVQVLLRVLSTRDELIAASAELATWQLATSY